MIVRKLAQTFSFSARRKALAITRSPAGATLRVKNPLLQRHHVHCIAERVPCAPHERRNDEKDEVGVTDA